jgi:hypothetical protein
MKSIFKLIISGVFILRVVDSELSFTSDSLGRGVEDTRRTTGKTLFQFKGLIFFTPVFVEDGK